MAAMIAAVHRQAARVVTAARTHLIAFALPQRCPGCGAEATGTHVLCDACFAGIPPLSFPLCARCLLAGRDPSGCARHGRHAVWAARLYDERAAHVVHAFKYHARPGVARVMADAITETLPSALRPDLVAAAPLHAARRRERGFDPAAVLARAVAERLDAPYLHDALVRTRATRPQVGLPERARRENMRDAFDAPNPTRLRGRRVLVVDDVLTTGATLAAALDALSAAGAQGVGAAFAWAQ